MQRFKDALNRNGRRILLIVALVMGAALVLRGLVGLLG